MATTIERAGSIAVCARTREALMRTRSRTTAPKHPLTHARRFRRLIGFCRRSGPVASAIVAVLFLSLPVSPVESEDRVPQHDPAVLTEIARDVNSSPPAIRMKLKRLRFKLRELLGAAIAFAAEFTDLFAIAT